MRYLDDLALCLVAAGRRVLRYDLYGRGWSSCEGWPHTRQLLVSQLSEVLLSLGLGSGKPVDLVGYSIGAQVAGFFAATHGHLVSNLVLVCPAIVAGPRWLPTLLQLPVVRELVGHYAIAALRNRELYSGDWLETASPSARALLDSLFPDELDRFTNEPHLARSFFLSIGSMPFQDGHAEWKRLAGQTTVRVTALCANLDRIAPGGANADFLRGVLGEGSARAHVELLPEYGHALPFEFPKQCAEMVLSALGETVVRNDVDVGELD